MPLTNVRVYWDGDKLFFRNEREQELLTVQESQLGGSSDSSSASLIHQASRTLTNAEITSWASQDLHQYVLVPGAGATRYAQFLAAIVLRTKFGAAYTNLDGSVEIAFVEFSGASASLAVDIRGWLNTSGAASFIARFSGEDINSSSSTSGAANKPIALLCGNSQDLAGGNAADTIVMTCTFMVYDSSTGLYLTTEESGWDQTSRTFA